MKKVLIGAVRSKGEIPAAKEGEKSTKFDNIRLYVADYHGYVGKDVIPHGFIYDYDVATRKVGNIEISVPDVKPFKVRTVDFEAITGVHPQYFLKNFEREFMFHKLKISTEENDYGRLEITGIKISELDCFKLDKVLKQRSEESQLEDFDESEELGEFDEDENYDDLGALEDSVGEFDFELDESSGEVKVKSK